MSGLSARLVRGHAVLENVQVVEPFWTVPKVIVAGLVLVVVAGFYYSHQKEQARLARAEAERQIAVAKAKEAESNQVPGGRRYPSSGR